VPADLAQSLATAGAQRPVPDVVTAAPQVIAVSVVVDATPVSSPAGPRSRDLCGGLAIYLVVIVAALAVIVLLRPARPGIVTSMLGYSIFPGYTTNLLILLMYID
jgi:hypothetical protein